ncbi:MAG: DUF1800 domain-containing protein, partial [Undibacterium sp.]|nr:DUF1800 domain-containing protein [Undibacterium sp.]
SSVVGYINFMQSAVSGSKIVGDLSADYSALTTLINNPLALLNELNLLLAAGQISASNLQNMSIALAGMPVTTTELSAKRLYAALTLVLASPEFIVLK